MIKASPESWIYFINHHDDIRNVIKDFLPIARMEIPNTRVIRDGIETAQRDSIPLKVDFTISDFDKAVVEEDNITLNNIMNSAWFRTPESRSVYGIPGFSEMCHLLDGTVDGFIPQDYEYDEDEDE